ncbi:MAG: hypothetical protein BWY21_00947 [Parcubacteria group bacterium ADurb.Bin216]|nr:MAG: hypothetical protein BWY21_00947 [Parcubacteria group bacterium ADurb.Bin216]
MKLEIEITEEQLKSGIERNIRTIIAKYSIDGAKLIEKRLKELYNKAVDDTINEIIHSEGDLKELVNTQIKKKIDKKLNQLLK